jgi:hypothetical protein
MGWRVIVTALVLLGGCTFVPARWEKSGASSADYERDGRACTEEAGTVTADATNSRWPAFLLDLDLFRRQPAADRHFVKCMELRGWRPAKN